MFYLETKLWWEFQEVGEMIYGVKVQRDDGTTGKWDTERNVGISRWVCVHLHFHLRVDTHPSQLPQANVEAEM